MANSSIDNIRKNLPKWLAMKNKTDSTGYKFLSCFGEDLDTARRTLNELQQNLYIPTSNKEIPSHVYKADLYTTENDFEVESNINIVDTIYKFFNVDFDAAIVDYEKKILYVNHKIDDLVITIYDVKKDGNGQTLYDSEGKKLKDKEEITYTAQLMLHHIWNAFDEFALMLGMERLYGESNESLKNRIINCLSTLPGSNHNPLVSGIARDLGIEKTKVLATPLCDVDSYDETDQISKDFMRYIEKMRSVFDVSKMRWDESFGALNKASMDYIPMIYDDSMSRFLDKQIQSGIGDGDDLLVEAPTEESDEQSFSCRVALRGRIANAIKFYPKHKFKYKIYAKGKKLNSAYSPKEGVVTIGASEKAPISFSIEADQEYDREDYFNLNNSELHNVEIVPSNRILNPDNRYIKVVATLKSNDARNLTPTVTQINIKYRTTGSSTDSVKTLTLDVANDNIDTSGSTLKLSKHTYSRVYSEPVAWLSGVRNGLEITSSGLKLPKTI